MLSRITEHLHAAIEATGYFEKIFPMAELIAKGDMVYPATYCEKGEYKSVNNFDQYNGLAYIRMDGKQRFQNASQNSDMPICDPDVQMEFPLRLVACIPKAKLSADDAFSDERVSRTLIAALTQVGGQIKQSLRASGYTSFPDAVDMDSRSILREEYHNVEKMQDINYGFSYCAIDFTVTIKIKASCITAECDEAYYG